MLLFRRSIVFKLGTLVKVDGTYYLLDDESERNERERESEESGRERGDREEEVTSRTVPVIALLEKSI